MKNQFRIGVFVLAILIIFGVYMRVNSSLDISHDEAMRMGRQIWQNECAGKVEGLTSWNQGEEFASVGIGHFIWYPEGEKVVFKESFPAVLRLMQKNHVALPEWLKKIPACPWKSREEFYSAKDSIQMQELRQLLSDEIHVQVLFMIERLHKALPLIVSKLPETQKRHVNFQFYRLSQTSEGLFVLLDYINFKGEGVSVTESYNGQRWGLLQVLNEMSGSEIGYPAVEEFIQSAKKILARRVENAPPERNEKRWLKGWFNRLDGYALFAKMNSL